MIKKNYKGQPQSNEMTCMY